jgi:hypothetical protein
MADRFLEQQQQTIRLPLYAHEEQRISNVINDVSWGMNDQVLVNCYPVVCKDPLQPDKSVVKIQKRMGWKADQTSINMTGGVTAPTTIVPKAILTMTAMVDIVVICYIDHLPAESFRFVQYRPANGTFTSLGTVATTANLPATSHVHLSELTVAGVPYLGIIISSDVQTSPPTGNQSIGYYSASAAGSLGAIATIADADFPPNATNNRKAVGPLVQLNNVIYVMTEDGWIHGSEPAATGLAQITVWNTLGNTPAGSYPDRGMGLRRYKHHLVAFGEESIEFFNDEGLSPPALPIQRTEQAFIKIGVVNQKSAINVDDILYFIGKSYAGQLSLYKLEGYTPTAISQPSQNILVGDRPYNLDLQVVQMHGTKHLITNVKADPVVGWWTGAAAGDTPSNVGLHGVFCYAMDSNAWWIWAHEFNSSNPYTSTDVRIYTTTVFTGSAVWRILVHSGREDGSSINYAMPCRAAPYFETSVPEGFVDTFREDNTATLISWRIPMLIVTNSYDMETTSRKFLRSAKIVGDYIRNYAPGGAPWTAFQSEGLNLNFAVDRTDDLTDNFVGATPSVVRSTNLVTNTGYRYYFNNLGAGRSFKFYIAINAFVPVRLEALELVVAQGTH